MLFNCPPFWTKCSSYDYGCFYFCSIEKTSFKRQTKYFDCASCKISTDVLPDFADCLDDNYTTFNVQSTERESDKDFLHE